MVVEVRGSQWFSSYQLSIWKYPDMNKVTDLTGRLQSRIWGCGGGGYGGVSGSPVTTCMK